MLLQAGIPPEAAAGSQELSTTQALSGTVWDPARFQPLWHTGPACSAGRACLVASSQDQIEAPLSWLMAEMPTRRGAANDPCPWPATASQARCPTLAWVQGSWSGVWGFGVGPGTCVGHQGRHQLQGAGRQAGIGGPGNIGCERVEIWGSEACPNVMSDVRQQGRHLLQRAGRQTVVGEQGDIGNGSTLEGRLPQADPSDEQAPFSMREQSE